MGKYSDILANAEIFKQEADKIFKAYDTDGSGYLDQNELRKPVEDLITATGIDPKTLSQEVFELALEEAFKELDTDKDGKVSPEEFLKFVEGYFKSLSMKE